MPPKQLHATSYRQWSLSSAIQTACKVIGDDGFAFISSPHEWRALRVTPSGSQSQTGLQSQSGAITESDLGNVFDARFFSPRGEIRWRRDAQSGRGVVLSLDHNLIKSATETTSTEIAEVIEQQYVVWGPIDSADETWATTSSFRTGPIDLPFERGATGEFLIIKSVELIAKGVDGNANIVDELLVSIARSDLNDTNTGGTP